MSGGLALSRQRANEAEVVETGIQVMVPSYVETGEKVRVDTRDGRFMERAK